MTKIAGLLLSCACAVIAADPIVGGPYVVHDSPTEATVVWLVPGTEAGPKGTGFEVKKTVMTGLRPNTRYEYRAGDQEAGKGSFKTPPLPGEPFTFIAYGDNRTRHDVHRRVVAAMLQHGVPDFLLQTGDLVENGQDDKLWPIFFDIERDLLRQTAFFPALGNHERNAPQFHEFFLEPKGYYSFDWGNAHFAVLNSDLLNVGHSETERAAYWAEEARWLEADLKAHQAAEFRFVAAHHGPFTAVGWRQGENPHMTALLPVFEKYHVTAGLFGHDHNYQHYLKNGIHYLISGGGGAPLYEVNKPPRDITVKVAKIENFIAVAVNGHEIHVEVIAIDGSVIDRFDIKSGK